MKKKMYVVVSTVAEIEFDEDGEVMPLEGYEARDAAVALDAIDSGDAKILNRQVLFSKVEQVEGDKKKNE